MGNGVAFQDIALKIWRLLLTRVAQKFENSMTTARRTCWLLYYDDRICTGTDLNPSPNCTDKGSTTQIGEVAERLNAPVLKTGKG